MTNVKRTLSVGLEEPSKGVLVHESSIIDEDCKIETGSVIWQFCHICEDAVIGKNVTIGQGVYVGPGVVIGEGCKIQNGVSIFEGVELGDFVFVGPSATFTNIKVPRAKIVKRHAFEATNVGAGASIGANTTIVCGNDLGRYCFIGAGSVVTHDVEAFSMQVGVPSEHVSWISKEGKIQINRPGF